jgi:murein L,D-transpeptidase YafK
MVHGDCSSRGCYSMTDESIAEIYALIRESFAGGNASVQLQIFPFRMTPQNLAKHASSPHLAFWKDIKEGYDRFELNKTPPAWDVCNREYVFDVPRTSVEVLDAVAACPSGSRRDHDGGGPRRSRHRRGGDGNRSRRARGQGSQGCGRG